MADRSNYVLDCFSGDGEGLWVVLASYPERLPNNPHGNTLSHSLQFKY